MAKSTAFTVKNWQMSEAPRRIKLLGDRSRPESATHIIEFPGGAIELSRLPDESYWVHVIVNRSAAIDDVEGLKGATTQIVDARVDTEDGIKPLSVDLSKVDQIAVLVRAPRRR